MPTPNLAFEALWSRTLVRHLGGEADLLIRITAPAHPAHGGERSPIDVAFVVDRSGSMSGPKVEAAKEAVRVALDRLDQRDRAAVVIFDDRIDLLHELSPVTAQTRREVRQSLDYVEARGSTNLGDGWLTGCQQIASGATASDRRRLRRAILLTDGQANVGIVDPGQLAQHAGGLRVRGVTTSTLGFGEGFDEQLLSAMAEAGGGNFEYIRRPNQLVSFFTRELGELLNAAAIGLTLRITLPDGIRGEVVSVLPAERHGKTFEVTIGDIPAGESVDVLMHLTTGRGVIGDLLPVSIVATWFDPANERDERWSDVLKPLRRAIEADVEASEIDPIVAEKATLQRVAIAQREALRLDREGRYAESRAMLHDIGDAVMDAPQTWRIAQEAKFVQEMASAPTDVMFDEHVHKRTASRTSRMGRGRSDREESLTEE